MSSGLHPPSPTSSLPRPLSTEPYCRTCVSASRVRSQRPRAVGAGPSGRHSGVSRGRPCPAPACAAPVVGSGAALGGGQAEAMYAVQEALSRVGLVCAYDRAGFGFSPVANNASRSPAPRPRTRPPRSGIPPAATARACASRSLSRLSQPRPGHDLPAQRPPGRMPHRAASRRFRGPPRTHAHALPHSDTRTHMRARAHARHTAGSRNIRRRLRSTQSPRCSPPPPGSKPLQIAAELSDMATQALVQGTSPPARLQVGPSTVRPPVRLPSPEADTRAACAGGRARHETSL